MGIGVGFYIRNLVAQAVQESVSDAREQGKALAISHSAARIGADYPSAFSAQDLRNRLFAEAALADVDVTLGRASAGRTSPKPH